MVLCRSFSSSGLLKSPDSSSETHVSVHVADTAAAHRDPVRPAPGLHQSGDRVRPGAPEFSSESSAHPGPESKGEELH